MLTGVKLAANFRRLNPKKYRRTFCELSQYYKDPIFHEIKRGNKNAFNLFWDSLLFSCTVSHPHVFVITILITTFRYWALKYDYVALPLFRGYGEYYQYRFLNIMYRKWKIILGKYFADIRFVYDWVSRIYIWWCKCDSVVLLYA